MSTHSCDVDGCSAEYSVGADDPSMFVSISITTHDVDGISERAFSVCEECAREIDDSIPALSGGTHT